MPESVTPSSSRVRQDREVVRTLCLWVRVAGAALAAAVFAGILRNQLGQPGRDYQTHLLELGSVDKPEFLGANSRVLSVPLDKVDATNGGRSFEFEFQPFPYITAPLTQARSIGFHFDLYRFSHAMKLVSGRRARVWNAELAADDGSVIFRPSADSRLRSGELFEFFRVGPAPATTNQPAHWRLRLTTDAPELVTLRCHVTTALAIEERSGHKLGLLYHQSPSQPGQETNVINFCFPFGRYTTPTEGAPPSRAELLAFLWQFNGGAGTILALTNVVALMLCTGLALFPWNAPRSLAPPWVAPLQAGLGVALIVGALSLAHAVLAPPFHGVDESPHFFSYHTWMQDEHATKASWDLGKLGHVARLANRPDQKFTAADRATPADYFILHPATMDTDPPARSASAAHFWQATRRLVEGRPVNEMLIWLRGLTVMVTALGFGLAASALSCARPQQPGTPWTSWLLLLVPSLPFFGMNYSNYPLNSAAGLGLAAGLALLLGRMRVPWLAGLIIGLSLGVALHTTISAVPLAAGVAVALLALPVRGMLPATSRDVRRFSEVAAFWGLLWLGLVATRLLSTAAFDVATVERLRPIAERLQIQLILSAPFWAVSLLVVAAYAGVEFAALAFGESEPGWQLGKLATKATRWASLGALLVVVHLVAVALRPCPQLGSLRETVTVWDMLPDSGVARPLVQQVAEPDDQPTAREYVKAVCSSFLASLGPGDRDFMVSTLFWGELGSLIPQAPNWLISALATLFLGGLAALLWRCAKTGNSARLIQLIFILAGLAAYLTLCALASQQSISKPSLHGRYLIVCYLLLLVVCGFGWEAVFGAVQRRHPAQLWVLAVATMLGVHLLSLHIVLDRFF